MVGLNEAETVLVLGDGPPGLQTAISIKQRRPDLQLLIIAEGRITPNRWPRTAAWPAAPAYLQPMAVGDDPRVPEWFAQTLIRAQELASKFPEAAHLVDVTFMHNFGRGYRPAWSELVESTELPNKRTADGWANGFLWKSYVLDPMAAHREMVAEAASLGVKFRQERIASLEHVAGLSDSLNAKVVVDALGLSSNVVFGDETVGGVVSHSLKWSNHLEDRRVVIADDDLSVISGPEWIYVGGTYEPLEIDPRHVDEANLALTDGAEDKLWSALYRLRPDLARALADTPPLHSAGIYPYRLDGIRLEPEFGLRGLPPVVHITGMGKSGWSLFAGAAQTAADHVLDFVGGRFATA